MDRVAENGSMGTASVQPKRRSNVFDLVKVGLSSTFAISIFIGIGFVVKHVAGPSTILSVLLAAIIAYLVGKFGTARKWAPTYLGLRYSCDYLIIFFN